MNRRLEALEARAGRVDEGVAKTREVLPRMSTPELRAYVNVLRRMKAGEEPVEEDGAILAHVTTLYEEVRNEH